jgi:hypothetical protein
MSEHEKPRELSDSTGRDSAGVVEVETRAEWEGYSPDTLAALLDP